MQLSHKGNPDAKEPTFYSASFYCVLSCFSRIRLFVTPWAITHQAPLSMVFSRQEYWSELPSPPVGALFTEHLLYSMHWVRSWQVPSGDPRSAKVKASGNLPWGNQACPTACLAQLGSPSFLPGAWRVSLLLREVSPRISDFLSPHSPPHFSPSTPTPIPG